MGWCPLGILCELYAEFNITSMEDREWIEPGWWRDWEVAQSEKNQVHKCECCGQEIDDDAYWESKDINPYEEWEDKDDVSDKDKYIYFQLLGHRYFLPEEVRIWAGLRQKDPIVGLDRMTTLSDIQGLSFEEIADLVEAHL